MASIKSHFDRRYYKNNYAGAWKGKIDDSDSKQKPARMYNPNKRVDDITLEDFDLLLVPPDQREEVRKKLRAKNKEHLHGLELFQRHRYGDELDILKAKFTKTKAEIENEKFKLILQVRELMRRMFVALRRCPKVERYVGGNEMRACIYRMFRVSIAIKKRYYRKNLLEEMDIEIDLLRELLLEANISYPEWIDDRVYNYLLEGCNLVGSIVGGLMKTAVV